MKQQIKYDTFTLYYTYKPRQKHTYISIEKDGSVSVRSPIKNNTILLNIIKEKEQWIVKQLANISLTPSPKIGRELLYLGEIYSLEHTIALELKISMNKIKIKSDSKLESCYANFYKKQCTHYIPSRVEYFANIMKLYPQNITFRKMKRRWGSCDSKRNLVFNSSIMKLKSTLIDYIIIHELAHIKHMNHSKEFHKLVESYLHDATSLKKELRNFRT